MSSNWTTDQGSWDLITQNDNILSFQAAIARGFCPRILWGWFRTHSPVAVLPGLSRQQRKLTARCKYLAHTAGRFTMGGDPSGDFWASPDEPAFYLHHAQIDRTWWMWQNYQPPGTRTIAAGGSITLDFPGAPPGPNGTIDDLLDLGIPAPPLTIAWIMSTVGLTSGPPCYIYD